MCSETSEAVGTNWEHAQLEIQKFLKIRIPLVCMCRAKEKLLLVEKQAAYCILCAYMVLEH